MMRPIKGREAQRMRCVTDYPHYDPGGSSHLSAWIVRDFWINCDCLNRY